MQKYFVNQHLNETVLTWVKSGEIAIVWIMKGFQVTFPKDNAPYDWNLVQDNLSFNFNFLLSINNLRCTVGGTA